MRADRVVLDANVLISAVLQPLGLPRAAVEAVCEARGVLLFSDETLEELRTRLMRPKFDRSVSRAGRLAFLARIEAVSEGVAITGARLGCRDPDDDKLLETALLGGADALVTGDGDLLVMAPGQPVPILTPWAFLDVLGIGRGTRRLAGGPLHGPGQGASPSASARRRRSGRRRSGRRSRPSDRASWRIAGPSRQRREPSCGAALPTTAAFSRRAATTGSNPSPARRPRAGRRGRSRDLRGRCASRQRREPSCGAPAVRFAPEARALLWRTCGALRARGASPLVAHLRCASRQRREPSCGAPAVRRLACRAGRGVEDLPRALRQQHVLGLCLRGRASRRGPRLRRPRRGPPGRPGHRPSIGVPSGAAGRSTTPGDCGARARSQAGRARGAARPSRAGSCRTRSGASAASFAAWPMATGRWSRSSAPCGATGFPPSRRPAPRPSACGVHSADAILNILARRCAGRAPAVRPRAVAARHDHDPRGGSRLAHDPRGGSRLAHDPRGGSRLAHDPRGGHDSPRRAAR